MPTNNKAKTSERRLDSLAKILECSSMCVAVACLEGKLLIAANEFNRSSQQSEHLKLITEIMNHFKKIANNGSSDIDRDNLIQKICKARLSAIGKGNLSLSEKAISKFITCKRLFSLQAPLKSECDLILNESHVFAKSSAAFADMQRIYRAFKKIEIAIKKARRDNFQIISENQLKAFKQFHASQILHNTRRNSKVHAEIQILTELMLKKTRNETYIGISKLCCFNCHCLLLAANGVFGEKFSLTRGSHLGKLDKNWDKPDFFFAWYKNNNILSTQLAKKIDEVKKLYEWNVAELTAAYGGYNMEAEDSSSNPSSESSEEKLSLYSNIIAERNRVFSEITEKDQTIQDHLELTTFCLSLLSHKILERFFSLTTQDPKEVSKIAGAFFADLQEYKITYDYNRLMKFFDSSYFPNITHKKIIIEDLKNKLQSKGFEQKNKRSYSKDKGVEEIIDSNSPPSKKKQKKEANQPSSVSLGDAILTKYNNSQNKTPIQASEDTINYKERTFVAPRNKKT